MLTIKSLLCLTKVRQSFFFCHSVSTTLFYRLTFLTHLLQSGLVAQLAKGHADKQGSEGSNLVNIFRFFLLIFWLFLLLLSTFDFYNFVVGSQTAECGPKTRQSHARANDFFRWAPCRWAGVRGFESRWFFFRFFFQIFWLFLLILSTFNFYNFVVGSQLAKCGPKTLQSHAQIWKKSQRICHFWTRQLWRLLAQLITL